MTPAQKLPWAVKKRCLLMVADYDRARLECQRRRKEILDAGGERYETYELVSGKKVEMARAYQPGGGGAGRTTEQIAMRLEALESTSTFKDLRAVEHARARIGAGMPEMLADKLREAIMINCQSGRRYPFERLFVVGISRSEFYRIRDEFLRQIATERGLF